MTKRRQLKTPKNDKPRVFPISSMLADRLRPMVEGREPGEPLFITPVRTTKAGKRIGGCRLEPDNSSSDTSHRFCGSLNSQEPVTDSGTATHPRWITFRPHYVCGKIVLGIWTRRQRCSTRMQSRMVNARSLSSWVNFLQVRWVVIPCLSFA